VLIDNNNVCSVRQSHGTHKAEHGLHGSPGDAKHRPETRSFAALLTIRVLRAHPEERRLRRVSKDEATDGAGG
jgi:hypothetical protein